MKIKFLGTGGAFTIPERDDNYQSSVLITKTGEVEGETITKTLLIDAGEHTASALYQCGLEPSDIDYIFITHNHSDHNSGLNYIGFKTYFDPDAAKPTLFADPKVMHVLWEHVLKGNMGSVHKVGRVKLMDYFNTINICPRDGFQILNTEFALNRLPHVIDEYDEVPAFGLTWKDEDIKYFLTGDTLFDFWRLMPFWEWSDIIFQECEFMEYENSVHCQFHQLKGIPDIYKNKMWLYHYSLGDKTFDEVNTMVQKEGFRGIIKKGQEFNTDEIKKTLK